MYEKKYSNIGPSHRVCRVQRRASTCMWWSVPAAARATWARVRRARACCSCSRSRRRAARSLIRSRPFCPPGRRPDCAARSSPRSCPRCCSLVNILIHLVHSCNKFHNVNDDMQRTTLWWAMMRMRSASGSSGASRFQRSRTGTRAPLSSRANSSRSSALCSVSLRSPLAARRSTRASRPRRSRRSWRASTRISPRRTRAFCVATIWRSSTACCCRSCTTCAWQRAPSEASRCLTISVRSELHSTRLSSLPFRK